MIAEIIVCEMLIKPIKLCVCDFSAIHFRFSDLIMLKYYGGICLWFFVKFIMIIVIDLLDKMFTALIM